MFSLLPCDEFRRLRCEIVRCVIDPCLYLPCGGVYPTWWYVRRLKAPSRQESFHFLTHFLNERGGALRRNLGDISRGRLAVATATANGTKYHSSLNET